MVLQSSQGLPELLFYTKKSYRILQLQLQLQFYKGTRTPSIHIQPTRAHPENSPSRIQFYMQKTKSSSSTTTTLQIPVSRNSTHRRQGDLLEMHPCVLQNLPVTFQAFSRKSLQRQLHLLQLFQRHSSLSRHSSLFSLSRQFFKFYIVPISPGIPPHSSILQLECIFYSSIGFHRNSTEYQLNNTNYKHSTNITFFKEREML